MRWQRLARRAHRVVWLNPRAAADGYQPLVGSMASALPYCDAFLPANTVNSLADALDRDLRRPLTSDRELWQSGGVSGREDRPDLHNSRGGVSSRG